MISLKSFIAAIQEAVVQAGESLLDKNVNLLDRYFAPSTMQAADGSSEQTLAAKTVNLEYTVLNQDLTPVVRKVEVPLITLIPVTTARIEKAVLSAEFQIQLVDGEVQIDFAGKNQGWFGSSKGTVARLEITISPQAAPEGLHTVVEAYEKSLKAQIP